MEPQPLFRVFAHPTLDHPGYQLHGRGDVDLAIGIPRQLQRFGDLKPQTAVGQADSARTVNGTIIFARQPSQHRIGLARPAEEEDIRSTRKVLVYKHSDA